MAIRKEQVLLLLTLGIGALIARSLLQEGPRAATWKASALEFVAVPVPVAALVGNDMPGLARRDFCTEPSETRPLPPRELAFPPRQPLSLASLPLDPGPDYGHMWALRCDGSLVEGVTLQVVAEVEATTPNPDGDQAPATMTRKEKEARAALAYDQIWEVGKSSPFFGTIEAPGRDLYELEQARSFEGVEIRIRSFNVETGKVGSVDVYGKDERKIERIELARTLRNEVQRRVRAVPALASHLAERRQLVEWMLEKAREAAWVYDLALEQAELYRQVAQGDLDGLRLVQRVLQARGDMAGEFALLDGLAGEHRESAFRHEGLGQLKARLGLWQDAESDLRRAAVLAPTDGRPHTALAEFLQKRGRSREALAAVRQVEMTFGSLLEQGDRVRAVRALVGCHLAMGQIEAARSALRLLPTELAQPYLEGCVSYAAGQVPAALGFFRQAGGTADSGVALLGQAACLLRDGQWQEAHDLLLRVVDQEPLLRHRAATGLALLFLRLGQYDSTLVWIDRALEADPQDPYAYYLRGRTLRLQGQLSDAAAALTAALRRRDDFVHAIAEMAAVQAERAREGRGADQAQAALAARRYGDRAVELVHTPAVELFELEGLHRFGAADPRAAGAAFSAARDLAVKDEEKLYAKGCLAVVDYSRGLVDDASVALQRMMQDLPKEAPMRSWADTTLAGIDDHAQKEVLEDNFERDEPGGVWRVERSGGLGAVIEQDALVFRSKRLANNGEVFIERVDAVRKAKNFLAAGVSMQPGPSQTRTDGFAGLRLEMQRGGGGFECRVQLGVREGAPYLIIEDGRSGGQDDRVQQKLEIAGFDLAAAQQLELRIVPRGDPQQSKTFNLQARWNGIVVHVHELKTLTANTQTELKTQLFAGGSKGNDLDVVFDDYRLERRKDR